MPNYVYKAVNIRGNIIKNEITAPSERAVIQHLQKLKLDPVDIKPLSTKKHTKTTQRRIKTKDVILFSKQLYTLLKSGVPILVSLNAIREQSNSYSFQSLIEQIANEVSEGNAFSNALAQFPKIFPPIYVNAVKIGEVSGTLEDTLMYLYKFLEEEEKVKQDVKKALRYPALVILGLLAAFLILTTLVIPKFIPVFTATGMELPTPTRILFAMYQMISSYGVFILTGVALLSFILFWYFRTDKGRFQLHSLMLKLPIWGVLLRKVYISRFAKTFFTMNRSGIPVVQTFETLGTTLENEVYRKEFNLILERIKEGEGIANSLRQSQYFSAFAVEMIAIGEKSGALDEMLESVTNYYDLEIGETVKNMTSLIEPVLTVFLGGMVLIFALAIFLPMWNMMEMVK